MTENFDEIIIYLGNGCFRRQRKYSTDMIAADWHQCNCSIKYRKLPYTLEEYKNKQMFADILTGCDR